ncbi:DUF5977 domain-containing protein [Chryseobacterium vrystaatense]|uniref:DUF5977 domain-containing protein n=1 Tax=Chryseobacterium vrystaatense TaxID=307480 RepID=A0A1M4YYN5_9FLAO|nr:DUF5977 domain-containing protein [Chryseobacterium vrystaatense]SHF10667.1 hypothetical protein SAMN02787073_1416 [Chryseobacterium vrystaatense]
MMKLIFSILSFSVGMGLTAQNITDAVYNAKPDSNPFNSNTLTTGSVNTYTGRADISIPLYTISFGGLEIPLSLMYNSEGIQVDQYASEVGLGWSLSSLGEIIKEINGNYEDNEGRDNWKAYLTTLSQPDITPTNDFPDFYTINSPNITGKFMIDRYLNVRELEGYNTANITFTRSRPQEAEALKYGLVADRKRIQDCPQPPAGPFVYYYLFTMTGKCNHPGLDNYYDTQQVKINKSQFTYTFSEIEHIGIITNTHDVAFRGSTLGSSTTNMNFNTGLKLTEIKDNTTKNTLKVEYQPLARYNDAIKVDKIWDKLIHRVDNGSVTTYSRLSKEFDVTTKETYIRKLPSKIKTNDVEIIFTYDNAREDKITRNMVLSEIPLAPTVEYIGEIWGQSLVNPYVKEPLLKSILIKNNLGQTVMQYNFVYDYFYSGCSGNECRRLKLHAVEKGYGENNLNKETHTFSYYEDKALPKIASVSKDVFGFKNDVPESSIKDSYGFPVRPFVYQYIETRNSINFSYFSPLNVQALNPVMTSGQYEQGISGLENIRAWTLKSITYPTQGVQSFTYEPHEFDWKGTKIKGGGLRIKETNMLDPITNKILTTKYSYGNGQISSLPLVTGDHDIAQGPPINPVKSNISRSFSTLVNKSKGSYVVYPDSRKTDPDGGYTDFKYSSYTEHPDVQRYSWIISAMNVDINMDRYLFSKNSLASKMFNIDYLRGNILSKKIYDKSANLIKESQYLYSTTEYAGPTLREPTVYPRTRKFYYPTASTYAGNFEGVAAQYTSSLIKRHNLTSIKEKDYLSGGVVNSEKNITYTDRFNLIKAVKLSGSGTSNTQISSYAFEGNDPLLSSHVDFEQMKIGSMKKTENEEVEKSKTTYAAVNGQIIPDAQFIYDYAVNDWVKKYSFDRYDNKGNILQITGAEGSSTVIWGYKQTKPIATIEGATYATVMQAFGLDPASNTSYLQLEIVKKSNLDINEATESEFLTQLDVFKSNPDLKDFQIKTDTYDPLIGVKTSTAVSGLKTKYVYDSGNRLEKVLDHEGKLLTEYKYNYASTRYYNAEKSKTFSKNCTGNGIGSVHVYTVTANTYSSVSSQAEADNKAENDINTNGQNYANTNGTCTN